MSKQMANGWFASNSLSSLAEPHTHTIGYVLRCVIEAYRFAGEADLLVAAELTADALLKLIEPGGCLPGKLDGNWLPTVDWVCLAGNVQIGACCLLLYGLTGKAAYLDAARRANQYVRRTVCLTGNPDVVGGVRGSFPVDGEYGRFEYLNWAAKFCIDSQLTEAFVDSQLPGAHNGR
ncbi:hypothetical protein [Accumulibacter sp.]|uniref:hypothetical protein n=1 Tax=Accumulibacter sp. TaxID=2053492 RepID=UPI00257A00E6|nr:hypothetical protein [Accumulibacter sp.]